MVLGWAYMADRRWSVGLGHSRGQRPKGKGQRAKSLSEGWKIVYIYGRERSSWVGEEWFVMKFQRNTGPCRAWWRHWAPSNCSRMTLTVLNGTVIWHLSHFKSCLSPCGEWLRGGRCGRGHLEGCNHGLHKTDIGRSIQVLRAGVNQTCWRFRWRGCRKKSH